MRSPSGDLSSVDYVYLWADGIHVNVRLDEAKLCLLVMIGVGADGRKELVSLTDGYRESPSRGRICRLACGPQSPLTASRDRSQTLTENYVTGTADLQPTSSLTYATPRRTHNY